MLSLVITLFLAGVLTILLPCILPLIPIVLGVSIVDRDKLRPLAIVLGMTVSFVAFTFVLQVFLNQFVELADYLRIATYYALLLFGLGFFFEKRTPRFAGAIIGSLFFLSKGWISVAGAAALGCIATEIGGAVAAKIQQLGATIQQETRSKLGSRSFLSPFLMGLTLGLVWVPCAGPALGFALALVREQPGITALFLLGVYALGSAIPLLLIGYGGQAAVHSVRVLSRYSETVKKVSGVLLILSAIGFQLNLFADLQTWISGNTGYGAFANKLEESFFGGAPKNDNGAADGTLPILGKAPTSFVNAGTWHNSEPLRLEDLRGKVVLIDFWTYSCINCIRTLPYIQGYWEKYGSTSLTTGKDSPFVLVGVHTPEFVFEKNAANVAAAIDKYNLTYPVVQDNDFGTWNAFRNRYWPAKYLIDAEGNIRYVHFGEGAYEEADAAIAMLLKEMGAEMPSSLSSLSSIASFPSNNGPLTPETYLHSRSWQSFGNSKGTPTSVQADYALPEAMELHSYYLGGAWQLVDDERQVLRSNKGSVGIRALAGEVNLVLGPEAEGDSIQAEVFVDGKKTKTLTIDRHDLYELYKGGYGEHDVIVTFAKKGVAGYAYTFGR